MGECIVVPDDFKSAMVEFAGKHGVSVDALRIVSVADDGVVTIAAPRREGPPPGAEPCACGGWRSPGYVHDGRGCGPLLPAEEILSDEDVAKIAGLNARKEAARAEVERLAKEHGVRVSNAETMRVHMPNASPAVPFSVLRPDTSRELREAADRMHGESLDLWGACIGRPRSMYAIDGTPKDGSYRVHLVFATERLYWEERGAYLP